MEYEPGLHPKKIYNFNLEIGAIPVNIGPIKQNNTNTIKLVMNIVDNGEPFDISEATRAEITFRRPDNTISNSLASINGNTVEYLLEPNAVNLPGVYEGEVQLFREAIQSDPVMLVTASFYYQIVKALANDQGITSQPSYPILLTLVENVQTLLTTATGAESSRATVESGRVTTENSRVSSESARVTAESLRASSESTRASSESSRVTAENGRVSAENTRVSNENTRQTFYNGYGAVVDVTTSTTLALATHRHKTVVCNSASAITLTVPTNSAQAFPIGSQINVVRKGTGEVTFSPQDGTVIILSRDNYKRIDGQYAIATIVKTGTNEWLLFGSLKV